MQQFQWPIIVAALFCFVLFSLVSKLVLLGPISNLLLPLLEPRVAIATGLLVCEAVAGFVSGYLVGYRVLHVPVWSGAIVAIMAAIYRALVPGMEPTTYILVGLIPCSIFLSVVGGTFLGRRNRQNANVA